MVVLVQRYQHQSSEWECTVCGSWVFGCIPADPDRQGCYPTTYRGSHQERGLRCRTQGHNKAQSTWPMKGRKNNNILSCKAFMENVEFPVLRKSRPIVSNRTKKNFKETGKRLTGFISCSGCLDVLMTPGFEITYLLQLLQHYIWSSYNTHFYYGEGVYTHKQCSFRGVCNFSRYPNPLLKTWRELYLHRGDIMWTRFPQTKQSTHALSSQVDSFVT